MPDAIRITADLAIPVEELDFTASRASGPGGQGVNTTDSRVELRFDVAGSPSLSDQQRERLLAALGGRLDRQGRLRVVAQTHRSQLLNRRAAVERLQGLLAEALHPSAERRPTRPGRAARQARLAAKQRRAAVKRTRRPPTASDDD
jgi:ribosome-associated protein